MNIIVKTSLAAIATLGAAYAAAAADSMPESQTGTDAPIVADAKAATPQTQCPVKGGDVDKSLYIDSDGKRIYVCCKGCLDTLGKDPGRYIKELEAKGITLDKTPTAPGQPQTKCPVMHGDINKDLYVDADGKRIYVCCEGCLEAVRKDPKKYVKDLEAQGIVLDKAK